MVYVILVDASTGRRRGRSGLSGALGRSGALSGLSGALGLSCSRTRVQKMLRSPAFSLRSGTQRSHEHSVLEHRPRSKNTAFKEHRLRSSRQNTPTNTRIKKLIYHAVNTRFGAT